MRKVPEVVYFCVQARRSIRLSGTFLSGMSASAGMSVLRLQFGGGRGLTIGRKFAKIVKTAVAAERKST